jgi:uncharacterized protein involved in exopolysaccharide biosynthesis
MSDNEAVAHYQEADSFDFRSSVATLRHAVSVHRWVVVATVVFTTVLVLLYVRIWPPTFQAEVTIAADSDKDVQRAAFYQGWNVFRKDSLVDESLLLTSPTVLREVVRELNLGYDDVYHPFLNYATHLWGQSWVGRNYRALKRWIFGGEGGVLSPEEIERAEVLNDFRAGVSVTRVPDSSMGVVVVKGSNPRVAEIANSVVSVYLRQRGERYAREAEQAYQSLRDEADKTLRELDLVDREARKFRAENGLLLLFEKDRAQISQWVVLRAAVTDLEAQIADSENALRIVERQLATESEQIGTTRVFKDNALQDRVTKLEMALAAAKQTFQPDAPEVRELEDEIRTAMAGIAGGRDVVLRNTQKVSDSYETLRAKKLTIESTLAGARASLRIKSEEAARMRALLDQIPAKMQVNREFERRQSVLEAKYTSISEKLTIAAVSMATAKSAPAAMRVVEPAGVPSQPVWPMTRLMLLAAVTSGLLLGALGALLLDLLFARATRLRLEGAADYRVFAVVDRDGGFLDMAYPARGARTRNA